MKLLYIASLLPVGSKEQNNIILSIAKKIKSRDINLKFIHPNPLTPRILKKFRKLKKYTLPKNTKIDEFDVEVMPYIVLPNASFAGVFDQTLSLLNKKKLDKYKNYNHTHAHYCIPDGVISYYLWKKFKIPYTITLRATDTKFFRGKKIFSRKLQKKILNSAKNIHVLSPSILNEFLELKESKKVRVIPHGIEIPRNKIKKESGSKIITVSALIKRKNVDWIINAVNKIDDAELKIIGKGPLRKKLESISSKKIVFSGKIAHKKVMNELRESNIFALPSYGETFGIAYIEAISQLNAVIAMRGTGIDGLFTDKEVVFCTNKKDFERKLKSLIRNKSKQRELRENAIKKLNKNFDKKNIINKYLELYT